MLMLAKTWTPGGTRSSDLDSPDQRVKKMVTNAEIIINKSILFLLILVYFQGKANCKSKKNM